MNFWVGVTDDHWFEFLRARQPDEVNFWRPGGGRSFRSLPPGGMFLFKLHSPQNFIVGGGFFVRHTDLPLALAWEVFREKNGAATIEELTAKIRSYRRDDDHNPVIGCTILCEPFFWDSDLWIPVPSDWKPNVVQGKRYSTEDSIGSSLWDAVMDRLHAEKGIRSTAERVRNPRPQYGAPTLIHPRLGQGAFRIEVTETYHRQCAMTGERTLPVLQAAHIKPFGEAGPNIVRNGLCLRSDLHILFDRGYLTITDDYHIEVSRRIRDEFQNGHDYYAMHGHEIRVLPDVEKDRPAKEFIQWHNEHKFAS